MEKVNTLIHDSKIIELSEYLQSLNSVDIAKLIMKLQSKDLILTFRLLPKDTASEVFSYLDVSYQQCLVETMSDIEVQEIVEELFLDDIVIVLIKVCKVVL